MAKSKKIKKVEVVEIEAVRDLRNVGDALKNSLIGMSNTVVSRYEPMLDRVIARVNKIADGLQKTLMFEATKDERVAIKRKKLEDKLAALTKQLEELSD